MSSGMQTTTVTSIGYYCVVLLYHPLKTIQVDNGAIMEMISAKSQPNRAMSPKKPSKGES